MKVFLAIAFVAFFASYSVTAFVCTGSGSYANPDDCSKFYQCTGAGATGTSTSCPAGTLFSTVLSLCDFTANVNCGDRCAYNGQLLPVATDCNSYYVCDWGRRVSRPCPLNLVFSTTYTACVFTDQVDTNTLCANKGWEVLSVDCTNKVEGTLYPSTVYCNDYFQCIGGKARWNLCPKGSVFHNTRLRCIYETSDPYYQTCTSAGKVRTYVPQ